MVKQIFSLCILILWLTSCKQGHENNSNPDVLELKNSNFNEDVIQIFGEWLAEEKGTSLDSLMLNELNDEKIKYSIKDPIISAIHIKVPKIEFGYLLESPFKDSISRYGPLYFNTVSVVTDLHKKPVAYQALAFYHSAKERDSVLAIVFKELGKPTDETEVNERLGLKALEWTLKDRTIQIVSFNAKELSMSSSSPDNNYYQVDFLMIANDRKEALKKAHYYKFTEEIKLEGKFRDYSYFDLKQNQLFSDRFLLYSDEKKDLGEKN